MKKIIRFLPVAVLLMLLTWLLIFNQLGVESVVPDLSIKTLSFIIGFSMFTTLIYLIVLVPILCIVEVGYKDLFSSFKVGNLRHKQLILFSVVLILLKIFGDVRNSVIR